MLSKSDPMVVVGISEVEGGDVKEIGRTEVIKDNINPVWLIKFIIDYRFEARQVSVMKWNTFIIPATL